MRVALSFLLPLLAAAQPSFYQFTIDQDRLAGAPDFSYLNHPLGPEDRIFVRDGHFFRVGPDLSPNTADDERVYLFGVNLSFGANFPAAADAARIARRLRRMGVNLVRLHHLDTQPDRTPDNAGSLLTTDPYPTLNPVAVTRLRTFLDVLKQEGMYINLNLKVGYVFRPAIDRVPEFSPFPTQSKPLHMIHPRLIELQAEYTRKTIDALGLGDDVALAMVEINNESSLLYNWQTSQLDRYLAGEYKEVFHRQWNSFLAARYGNTERLREAWSGGAPDGPNLLSGQWRVENHGSAPVRTEAIQDEVPVMVVRHTSGTQPIIIKQVGFSVTEGKLYLADVEMRADLPEGVQQNVYWDVKQDISPWRTMTGRTVAVSSQWRKFTMPVQAGFGMEGIGRFGLSVERVTAPVWIRGARLHQRGLRGWSEGEEIEAATIALPAETDASVERRADDYLLFLVERDRAYLEEMLRAVRDTAHPLVPVAGTQVGYGGLLNLDSHDPLDYQDGHFYVDHYNFPNVAWDSRDWRIRDQSNVATGMTPFQTMAVSHQAGRPFTVSEYNQNWPNTYAAEIDPALAVFGRFQDWDSIMHFAYSHNRNWDAGTPAGFDINGDWTKVPGFGQAAWLFRSGAIRGGLQPVEISLPLELRLRAGRERRNNAITAFLNTALGYDPNTAFVHPVRLAKDAEGELPERAKARPAPFRADTGEFSYDRAGRRFLIHAPMAAGIYGFLGRVSAASGDIELELAESSRGFAAVTVTALDGKPLKESSHLLISNPGYALCTQPGSNPARPQRLVNYLGQADWWTLEPDQANRPSGNRSCVQGPAWMERVEAYLTLRTTAAGITVYPLDGAGGRMQALPAEQVTSVEGGFRLHLQAEGQSWSPWYEVAASVAE